MKTSEMNYETFIGIDVSKLTLDVTILDPQSGKLYHRVFDNSNDGYMSIKKWLVTGHCIELRQSLFCMEHTGLYTRSLERFLDENKLNVWKESSLN
jgi:transposase